MTCRLIVTLPICEDGPDVDAVYEDVGEMDAGSRAGLKALYSDARKRAGVAAGIGAYLYTALAPVVLPIGPKERQVQLIRRSGKPDTLTLSPATEQWLRHGYQQRMSTEAVKRDLGEMLAHGEPERGMGQGEAAEQPDARAARTASTRARPATQESEPGAEPDSASPSTRTATASWSSTSAGSAPRPLEIRVQRPHDRSSTRRRGARRAGDAHRRPSWPRAFHVPTRLPDRYDGEPLRHLSPSSYALWVSCPEFCARAGLC